ncbi:MAG: thioesterase family protein, partial [Saccharothrix sp.]|nr:thioesterase family protein [Saccharothrix sp.]
PRGWATGRPTGAPRAEYWLRFADGRVPDTTSLAFLVDSAAPTALELGRLASATVELTVHVRARPASAWLAARAGTRHLAGGYYEEDVELWDPATGRLVAQSRQLAVLTGG